MSNYECSLQGIVIGQEQKEKIMQRLVGLCGNDSIVDLFEHELIFTPSSKKKKKKINQKKKKKRTMERR
jgi:hypothetical protein